MLPDNLIFINAVPLDQYFIWQEEVMITNFQKHGIKNIHVLVWYPEVRKKELKEWDKLKEKYPDVKFFYYRDQGVDLGLYIPQLRPHILAQHFKKHDFSKKVFFYHDSDIIFSFLPNFEELVEGPINWQSDTSSYLDYDYMKRKEEQGKIPENEAIGKFAEIGGISIDTIKSYAGNTGGAQYILKGIDSAFWKDVERMCIHIRGEFSHHIKGSINDKYFSSESEGYQSWCADMWAVNFSLWKRNRPTSVTKELAFSWATDNYQAYLDKPIFHNAGVVSSKTGLFYKGEWINKSPLHQNLPNPPIDSASRAYIEAINAVK